LTGETQLRARRTRLKILRAIAEKNGSAGFSEIRDATGLSTGSIYYHLERMDNYVSKDYKHYVINEVGLQLLREVDSKGTEPTNEDGITSGNHQIDDSKSIDESGNVVGFVRENVFILVALVIVGSLSFGLFSQLYNLNPPSGLASAGKMIANATIISSLSIAGLLSASFLVMLKRRMIPAGYRGIMLSTATVLAVILVNILIFTGLVAQIGIAQFTY
jgi:hypothetical protein